MKTLYNEADRYCCDWLSNLMDAGMITAGVIDDRPIEELEPDDIRGYDRIHFFAGIAGWDLALRLAGWPATRPVWTGSCPCQPFSAAGAGQAADDERHLWPQWMALIRECKPAVVFGEQVEAAIGWGWLDVVCADLEAEGYAVGATVLPACAVGAPHIRNRLWFVANIAGQQMGNAGFARDGAVADSIKQGQQGKILGRADSQWQDIDGCTRRGGAINELGNAYSGGSPTRSGAAETDGHRYSVIAASWDDIEWIGCSDGKMRPTKPGIFPLAHGISGRVGQLRAAGNAIVPQVAAEFIKASMMSEGHA